MFIILAFVGVLLQSFSRFVICVTFELNKDYIAKNLCVKKDVPKNRCNGKCHLQKQLAEADKREQSPPVKSTKEVKEVQLYYQQQNSFMQYKILFSKQVFIHPKPSELPPHSLSVFHPPPKA